MDQALISAVERIDEKRAMELVENRLQNGIDPLFIQEQIRIGMEKVGELYEKGECFIADLIMVGNLFKSILEMEEMKPRLNASANKAGSIVLGTAFGDLHDIGKNIFGSMMKAVGFEVIDLGIDVSAEDFCKAVQEIQPDIVGISGVLTLALDSMKVIIGELEKAGLRDKVKIILGGNCINPGAGSGLGADASTKDPSEGLHICLSWVKRN
ncbi:cobalamin B12-binding domain-containing protein [Candidatus Formimonas warabiya]|uniref:Cobalamin-binding protein n=1 Tax=Formimonas warabiya TaxID=1761012 RepID=A0A3G1KXL7_FORW1|nr:cobalamin-dependent protein [Candidatus Formimonas warabiya]ATW27182.1 cobalamin-binding protein [Candidatus Formimonas warabiya]